MHPSKEDNISTLRSAAGCLAHVSEAAGLGLLWHRDPSLLKAWVPACLEALAQRALSEDGDVFAAYDLASSGIELARQCDFPIYELERLRALALARSGSTEEARTTMERLISSSEVNTTASYGLLARTFRDLGKDSVDPVERQALFRSAADWAEKGWLTFWDGRIPQTTLEATDFGYLANQVSQFSFLGNDVKRAEDYRSRVHAMWERLMQLPDQFPMSDTDRFWWETNLAEMALVGGNIEEASSHYSQMRGLAPTALGDISANAKVCKMLLEGIGLPPNHLDSCFALPPVWVFSGHMFDAAESTSIRFPVANAERVKARIVDHLSKHGITDGYCSVSSGGDLLFAEAVIELGGTLHLVMPFGEHETVSRCVAPAGEIWVNRFETLTRAARTLKPLEWVKTQSTEEAPDNIRKSSLVEDLAAHFAYTNRVLLGMATLRSSHLGIGLQPLVVWDESDIDGPTPGGTGDFFELCRTTDNDPLVVNPITTL